MAPGRVEDRVDAALLVAAVPVELAEVGDVHLAVVAEIDVGGHDRLEEVVVVDDLEARPLGPDAERLDAVGAGEVAVEEAIAVAIRQAQRRGRRRTPMGPRRACRRGGRSRPAGLRGGGATSARRARGRSGRGPGSTGRPCSSRCRRPRRRRPAGSGRPCRSCCRRRRGCRTRRRRAPAGCAGPRATTSSSVPSGLQRKTAPVRGPCRVAPSRVSTWKPAVADGEVELAVGPPGQAVQVVAEEGGVDAEAVQERLADVGLAVAVGVAEPPEVGDAGEVDVAVAGEHPGGEAVERRR